MKDWPSPHDGDEPEWKLRIEFAVVTIVGALGLLSIIYFALSSFATSAHPGGLGADGGHSPRTLGGRLCHGGYSRPAPKPQRFTSDGAAFYATCSAARAVGAAPVRRGDPGYASHLDRDGDGIGCE